MMQLLRHKLFGEDLPIIRFCMGAAVASGRYGVIIGYVYVSGSGKLPHNRRTTITASTVSLGTGTLQLSCYH